MIPAVSAAGHSFDCIVTHKALQKRNAKDADQHRVSVSKKDPETTAKNVVAMEVLPAEAVALKALPGCSIRWMDAADARVQIETTAGIDLQQYGGELPADDFYLTME